MGRRAQYIDPYMAMMNKLERYAWAYALIAGITLAASFFVASLNSEGAGQFASLIEQVRYLFGLGLLCASGASCAVSLWSIGRYAYFAKWPERFE